MTLHEAIVEVLSIASRAMTAPVIVAEVNRLGHYTRRDGLPVPANQISADVNKLLASFRAPRRINRSAKPITKALMTAHTQPPWCTTRAELGYAPLHVRVDHGRDATDV